MLNIRELPQVRINKCVWRTCIGREESIRMPAECLRGTECENAHGNEACDREKTSLL